MKVYREVFSDVDASNYGGNLGRQSENIRCCRPVFLMLLVSCVSCSMVI